MVKIRLGFVTNSSSTNHLVMWKGNPKDLLFILTAHRAHFDKVLAAHHEVNVEHEASSASLIQELLLQIDNAGYQYIGDMCPEYDFMSNPRMGSEGSPGDASAGYTFHALAKEFTLKSPDLFIRPETSEPIPRLVVAKGAK
jgi:hypothetical protein